MNIAIYSGSHNTCTRLRVYGFRILRLAHQLLHMTSQARARGQTNQAGRDPRGPLLLGLNLSGDIAIWGSRFLFGTPFFFRLHEGELKGLGFRALGLYSRV